jgi:type IV secretory pathway ATPase VirB11/archaellum biosynthesis ATPase
VKEEYKIDCQKFEKTKIPNKVGEVDSLFNMAFVKDQAQWKPWTQTVPAYTVPKDASYTEVIVPNVDSIRIQYVLKQLLMQQKHVLIVGSTGTGKSIIILNELKDTFQNDEYAYLSLAFSAQTSAN